MLPYRWVSGRACRVAGEDAVLGGGGLVAEERRGGGQVAAPVADQADLARIGAAVPPELVARRAGAREEVADRQVLHADAAGLPDQDAVAADRGALGPGPPVVLGRRIRTARRRAGPGTVHDHRAAVHAAQRDAGLADEHAAHRARGRVAERAGLVGVLVVVTRGNQDPVAPAGRVDCGLDAPVPARHAVERADQQHARAVPARPGGAGCGRRERQGGHQPPGQCRRRDPGHDHARNTTSTRPHCRAFRSPPDLWQTIRRPRTARQMLPTGFHHSAGYLTNTYARPRVSGYPMPGGHDQRPLSSGRVGRRPRGGPAAAGDAELADNAGDVHADGLHADEQLSRDLAVAPADRDEPEHLELAGGEAPVPAVAGCPAARSWHAGRAGRSAWPAGGCPDRCRSRSAASARQASLSASAASAAQVSACVTGCD